MTLSPAGGGVESFIVGRVDPSQIPLRLEALERLYDATLDAYISKVMELKSPVRAEGGQVLTDSEGRPLTVLVVQRTNLSVRARILDQIAEEVGDKVERKGHPGKDLSRETDPRTLSRAELQRIARGVGASHQKPQGAPAEAVHGERP